jgi:Na+-driven multidrug efflux pump
LFNNSGVAVGSGWQSMVAYVNIGCYYLIGIPMGILLGWLFNLGVLVRCACIPLTGWPLYFLS